MQRESGRTRVRGVGEQGSGGITLIRGGDCGEVAIDNEAGSIGEDAVPLMELMTADKGEDAGAAVGLESVKPVSEDSALGSGTNAFSR
jgi:hypothetical protein